jgi:hypothetical protein
MVAWELWCMVAWELGSMGARERHGFDAAAQRLSFSCFKQCVKSKDPAILELYRNCPHRPKQLGFSTHVPIAQRPRLLLEIPRGTQRFRQLHCLPAVGRRSAAERTNSTLKDDNAILREPPVKSHRRAAVVFLMGVNYHVDRSCHALCPRYHRQAAEVQRYGG